MKATKDLILKAGALQREGRPSSTDQLGCTDVPNASAPSFIITAVWPRLPETILKTFVLSFWAMKGCFEVVVGYTRVCRLSLSNSQIGE